MQARRKAAATLGMKRGQTLRRIVLPQALRIVIPPIGNDTISMLKFTSLVSVLALPDLLYSAQMVYARTYQTVPLLLVATIWYLVLTTVLTVVEHAVEHRLKSEHPAGAKKAGGFFPFRALSHASGRPYEERPNDCRAAAERSSACARSFGAHEVLAGSTSR